MMYKYLLSSILVLSLLSSCGKDVKDDSSSDNSKPPRGEDNVIPGPFIQKQKLVCEDPLFCPNNVAKVIVVEDEKIRYCTGTLIGPNKLVTSASCLPRALKIPNLDCSENIYAVFPSTPYQKEETVACKKIEVIDLNLFTEPALWKQDIVILELERVVTRDVSPIAKLGLVDNEDLVAWKIDYISETMGILKRDECRTILNTYLNPFSVEEFSPMFVANECQFQDGNMGTPLMRENEIIGIFSVEMRSRLYNYLKNSGLIHKELDRYYHFTNMACIHSGKSTLPKQISDKCDNEISVDLLDVKRAKLLEGKSLHQNSMNDIENEAEKPNKYFIWNFEFHQNSRSFSYEAHMGRPKCIYKSNDWIGAFRRWRRRILTYGRIQVETPHYVLKTKLDQDLRPISIVDDSATKTYVIEFNPFQAHVNKSTYVTITSELHGQVSKKTYESVEAFCE